MANTKKTHRLGFTALLLLAILSGVLLTGWLDSMPVKEWSQKRRIRKTNAVSTAKLIKMEVTGASNGEFQAVYKDLETERKRITGDSYKGPYNPPVPTPVYPPPPTNLRTPTSVEVTQGNGFRKIAFPPNAEQTSGSPWWTVDVLGPNETVQAESGFYCHPAHGVTDTNGTGQKFWPNQFQKNLPDGGKPFCAVVWKVENGIVKVAVNDFAPFAVDTDGNGKMDNGRYDNLGAPSIIIRSR